MFSFIGDLVKLLVVFVGELEVEKSLLGEFLSDSWNFFMLEFFHMLVLEDKFFSESFF